MSRWFVEGRGIPQSNPQNRETVNSSWVEPAIDAMRKKVATAAAATEELHTLLDSFELRGGLDEITDDDGNAFTDIGDFLERELGVSKAFHTFLIDS